MFLGIEMAWSPVRFSEPSSGLSPLIEKALGSALEMAKEMIGAAEGGIMFYEPDRRLISLQYPAFNVSREMVADYKVSVDGVGAAVRAFRTRQPFISNCCLGDPNVIQRYAEMYRVEKLLTMPLEFGSDVIGVWHLSNKKNGDWEAKDAERFQMMARGMAGLIEQARQLKIQQTRHRIWQFLLWKLAGSADVQGVADALARLFGADVIVFDQWGFCRAKAGITADQIPLNEKIIRDIKKVEFLTHPGKYKLQLKNGQPCHTWVIPLPSAVVNRPSGHLLLRLEKDDCPDKTLLCEVALVLSVALAGEERLSEIMERFSSDFLNKLMAGALNETEAYLRAARLGLDLHRPRSMVLAAPDGFPLDVAGAYNLWTKVGHARDLLRREIENAARDYWVGTVDDCSLLVLAAQTPGRGAAASALKELARNIQIMLAGNCPEISFSVAVGEVVCENISDYPVAYREVKTVLDTGKKLYGAGRVFAASDLGALLLFSEEGFTQQARAFSEHLLGRLVEHDQRHNTHYLKTLAVYLETGGNLAITARKMYTHVNTVRYRLSRVEEITGKNLKCEKTRFDFLVAIKVRSLINADRFPNSDPGAF